MATQTIEFRSPPSQTITAKLFAVGSDTQVDSVSTTEATNRKGTYAAAYTDVAAGEYELIALVSTTPVARWFVTLTLTTATFQVYDKSQTVLMVANVVNASALAADAVAEIADGIWDEATSGHTTAGTYGGRIVRSTNSNVEVQITGSNHVAADVHAFQTDVIDSSAIAASAVAEIQSGLATAATALSTTQWTNTLAADIGTTNTTVAIGIDATISSRMATYTQPTGFLAATFPVTVASTTNITAATGITVSSINANVMNASALAADAVAEIQSGLATPTNITAGTLTTVTNLTNAPTAGDLTAAMKASVNAEVLDVMNVDTFAELAAPPAATSSLRAKITWLFMWARNKSTQSSTQRKLFADDTTTLVGTETVGDSAGVFTKGEVS